MESIIIRVEIFKEDGQYVAVSPELNVSSFGNTPEEAKASLSEAVSLYRTSKISKYIRGDKK